MKLLKRDHNNVLPVELELIEIQTQLECHRTECFQGSEFWFGLLMFTRFGNSSYDKVQIAGIL